MISLTEKKSARASLYVGIPVRFVVHIFQICSKVVVPLTFATSSKLEATLKGNSP